MDATLYRVDDAAALQTPALLYYPDLIEENTRAAISIAGGAERLWPHIKTHKMREMVAMQQSLGIARFKCATIAEAKMLAELKAAHILIAYPLVGPNIGAFVSLAAAYPDSVFYALGDDAAQIALLSEASARAGLRSNLLLDVNMGMDRTGAPLRELEALYAKSASLPGIHMHGLHGYDGHANDASPDARAQKASPSAERILGIQASLAQQGIPCELIILGGTPSFPIHAKRKGVYLSPGTIFVLDARYMLDLTDLPMRPAAALATRVISHPAKGLFTVDLGSKAISTDMQGRGLLLSIPEAVPVRHSEEHWVFQMPEGSAPPPIGELLYALPMHICTTTMLYPWVHIVKGRKIVGKWAVAARDRYV